MSEAARKVNLGQDTDAPAHNACRKSKEITSTKELSQMTESGVRKGLDFPPALGSRAQWLHVGLD